MTIRKIMIAEDDDEDVVLFQNVLSDLKVNVNLEVAANGVALMKMLDDAAVLPELIFLDLNMPFKNGMVCLQEIKAISRYKNIKIIILSTSSHQDQIKAAYDNGCDFYIVKLCNYNDFKNAVAACLLKNWQSV